MRRGSVKVFKLIFKGVKPGVVEGLYQIGFVLD